MPRLEINLLTTQEDNEFLGGNYEAVQITSSHAGNRNFPRVLDAVLGTARN